ncbi:hypothetical protein E2C01_070630 [Portunus trituberculatus]|uniref:Uncharacterized protein n=1 Tax=Portunus trituberculatus TaxID=210409 RepID=A0A5B7I1U7_PORTR|nr:hypothetical protein [Portunus trituberculatus]
MYECECKKLQMVRVPQQSVQMYDLGEDASVEHVVLECERERRVTMQVILTELGHNRDKRMEMTGREWMVLLLGLCSEKGEGMIEAMKEFLEKMCVSEFVHKLYVC